MVGGRGGDQGRELAAARSAADAYACGDDEDDADRWLIDGQGERYLPADFAAWLAERLNGEAS